VKQEYTLSGGSNPTPAAKKYNRHSALGRVVGRCCTEGRCFFSTCYTFKYEQIEHNGAATTLWWRGVKWSEPAGISVVPAGTSRGNQIALVSTYPDDIHGKSEQSFRLIFCICHCGSGGIAPLFLITELDGNERSTCSFVARNWRLGVTSCMHLHGLELNQTTWFKW
jgi:hypothetical protein